MSVPSGTTFIERASAQLTLSGQICIQCVFYSGAVRSWGCEVHLKDNSTGYVVRSLVVPKTEGRVSQNCEYNVQPGAYTVVVFDTNHHGVVLGKQPAYIIETVFIIPAPSILESPATGKTLPSVVQQWTVYNTWDECKLII